VKYLRLAVIATAMFTAVGLGSPAAAQPLPAPVITARETVASSAASTVESAASVKPTTYNCYNSSKYVRLTFDDTSTVANLKSLLATLKKYNVKATFFFNTVNTSAAEYKMIRDAGMDVGNHTYDHKDLTRLSRSAISKEWTRGRSAYTNTDLMRPPYGATNSTVRSVITDLGGRQCLWNVDTMDWSTSATRSAADIVRRVRSGDKWTPPAHAGDVVLMHGTGRYTAAALAGVIKAVLARGLTLQPLNATA